MTDRSEPGTITEEIFFPYSPALIWSMIADSAHLSRWLLPNDFQPRVGHEFEFRAPPRPGWHGITRCKVLVCEPQRRLAYTWTNEHLDTVVDWRVVPAQGGTRLRLKHFGFQGAEALEVMAMLAKGWGSTLLRERLPAAAAEVAALEASSS